MIWNSLLINNQTPSAQGRKLKGLYGKMYPTSLSSLCNWKAKGFMQYTGIQWVALLPFNVCKYTVFNGEYFKNISLK